MVKTIGNPLSWTARAVGRGWRYCASATTETGGVSMPERTAGEARSTDFAIRRIGLADLREALSKGADDLMALRSDAMAICLVYPLVGLLLFWFALDRSLMHLLFPLIGGFALLGPVAAVGLYEMSRRRELGRPAGWRDALALVGSTVIAPIALLGAYLLVIFVFWLFAGDRIYAATLGPEPPVSLFSLLRDTVTTGPGWIMLFAGIAVGFLFAALVLSISIVSFPLLIDRHVGLPVAVGTSVKMVALNPAVAAGWGVIVAAGLAISAATFFVGLILVLPVLGHSTWHLYRRAIVTREG